MNTAAIKRGPRTANFNAEEVRLLIDIVSSYAYIIECKLSDTRMWEEKSKAWKEIEAIFNSRSSHTIKRTHDQLKKKYEALKKNVKEKSAKIRQSLYKTGGGPPCHVVLTPIEETLQRILAENIQGLESEYDPDYVEGPGADTGSEAMLEVEVLEEEAPEESQPAWSGKFCPADLRQSVNSKLKRVEEEPRLIIVPPAEGSHLPSPGPSFSYSLETPLRSETPMKTISLGKRLPRKRVKADFASAKIAEYAEQKIEAGEAKKKFTQEEKELKIRILEEELKFQKESHIQQLSHREEKHKLEIQILEEQLKSGKAANSLLTN